MPKVKIGEKVVAGDQKSNERKIFTNGHKSWTAPEAKRLLEQQKRERVTLQNFEERKDSYIRPRNPITGDATPRVTTNIHGEVTQKTGVLLFPPKDPSTIKIPEEDYSCPTGRTLAIPSGRRNHWDPFDGSVSNNPLKRLDFDEERISSLQNKQDNLQGEIEYMNLLLRDKKNSLLGSTKDFRF